ncbi:MAG: copper chaperone PCu(A)C, partial [Acidimicrobiales bacterium]|nr:copper chaperone PCu(A)C [Acidimicrobiales bacterium]
MTTSRRLLALVAALLLGGLSLAACGDDSDDASGAVDGLEVTGAWARTSPMMATAGAAYMQITSNDDDRIVSASVPADVAAAVEIHEVVPVEMADGDMADGDMGDDEMADHDMGDGEEPMMDMPMTMRELQGGLELPAGETVTLQPGGYHIMLLDLPDALEIGETFELELTLE